MERIKGTVESLLANLKARSIAGDPEEIIGGIFTPKEREHIRVLAPRNGRVRVAVDSSTWLYYFTMRKKDLLEKIAASLPQIKELSFMIGDVTAKKRPN